MTGKGERDEYGIGRAQAADLLWSYTRTTLGDAGAQVTDLRLQDGRWQARLVNSRTGAESVFLHQHGGRIVGGHTSAGPATTAAHPPQGEASYRHQRQAQQDRDESRPTQGVPTTSAAEREELEAEGPVHFQTLKWHEPTQHRA